jgi:2-keto-4-pentenoate hydratase/2-oxohepta-3-ene-1,7-dioic acid hydratase in catechol pathway
MASAAAPAVRLVNLEGRAGLDLAGRVADVEGRSGGRFGADPMDALGRWSEFAEWAAGQTVREGDPVLEPERLGPCVPRPRAVFAIGLNYRDHAAEAGLEIPASPMVFTKFPSCLAGPRADVPLTSDRVDWEVELVLVMGRRAHRVSEAEALESVAGCCVGQDISDRRMQFSDRPPQFSLGKSATAFGPIGPAVVSLDAVGDPDDLELSCTLNGEVMQSSRTSEMIFPVRELVAYLSATCTLEPGDLVFTGTPAGVGSVREPRRYLSAGDVIESRIEGLGELRNRCVGA